MSEPMKSSFDAERRTAKDFGERLADAGHGLDHAVRSAGNRISDAAGDLKDTPTDRDDHQVMRTLKDQASQAAQEAKATVAAMADEARVRIAEIIDQQKNAGADQVAGVARAAQTAAGDLEQKSPQLARLVRTAAESVDHVAEDIRASSLTDILGSLSNFGRRQPVALFGGAVLAGFLLTRFLKSDPSVQPVHDDRVGRHHEV